MHAALTTFFETHKARTCECRRTVHDAVGAILKETGAADRHMMELREQLQLAELEAHDGALDPKIAMMHKRLRVVTLRAEGFRQAAREFAKALADMEREMTTDETNIVTVLRSIAARVPDQRASDQQSAIEEAFAAGTLPEEDRRAGAPATG